MGLIDVQMCNEIHLGLSAIATIGNFVSMMLSIILLAYITTIPDSVITEFFERFGWVSSACIKCCVGGLWGWCLDMACAGIAVHGSVFSVICGFGLVLSMVFV